MREVSLGEPPLDPTRHGSESTHRLVSVEEGTTHLKGDCPLLLDEHWNEARTAQRVTFATSAVHRSNDEAAGFRKRRLLLQDDRLHGVVKITERIGQAISTFIRAELVDHEVRFAPRQLGCIVVVILLVEKTKACSFDTDRIVDDSRNISFHHDTKQARCAVRRQKLNLMRAIRYAPLSCSESLLVFFGR